MSSNLITQVLSLVLWIFALAGLDIQAQTTGDDIVRHISTQNWPLLAIVIINLGNSIFSWAKTWKTDKPNFLMFLRSPNWWISFTNIVFGVLAMQGISIPVEASEKIITMIFNGQYWTLIGYLIPNVIGPVIRKLTAKPLPVNG